MAVKTLYLDTEALLALHRRRNPNTTLQAAWVDFRQALARFTWKLNNGINSRSASNIYDFGMDDQVFAKMEIK